MIARIWRGVASAEKAEQYFAYLIIGRGCEQDG
jgi:hypothetical protein